MTSRRFWFIDALFCVLLGAAALGTVLIFGSCGAIGFLISGLLLVGGLTEMYCALTGRMQDAPTIRRNLK